MKKLVGVLVVLFMVVSFAGVGYAEEELYVLGWQYVQKRTFENGKTVNRVAVAMYWNSGMPVDLVDHNVVEELKLYGPDGEMELTNVVIQDGIKEILPSFNSPGMFWQGFDAGWQAKAYYIADIVDELIPGTTYRVEVLCDDGNLYDKYVYFGEPVDLPVASSKSFKYEFDADGNFYFHWEIPKGMYYLGPDILNDWVRRPQVRTVINFYNNGIITNRVWMKLPYLMSGIFIPATSGIFDTEADYIDIAVELRLDDNTYRTYSDFRELKKLQ